ncbi:Uncharacterised protein [Peptoniphilus harei]|uniref:HTH arsR-type domain-containing protein n=1 Tax=Peptoniphilus harei TaxID=54005 RepID=A0A2X1YX75_9FIRM|nr:helix-turn-helix transcriptional regulator [Peptoniphilus harei]SPY36235.1 Uncharacterised protein [Peptoniphilus harei]
MKTKNDNLENTAEVLKVMAHPIRLKIIKSLIDNGPSNVDHYKKNFIFHNQLFRLT